VDSAPLLRRAAWKGLNPVKDESRGEARADACATTMGLTEPLTMVEAILRDRCEMYGGWNGKGPTSCQDNG
jgi:hypothetical protein